MQRIAVEIKGIVKHFGKRVVLDGVTLEIKSGDVVALLAKNASGKSTLIRIIAGLIKRDSGEILINGRKPVYPDIFKELSVLIDPPSFYPHLKVIENLEYFSHIHGCEKLPTEKLGLHEHLEKRVKEASHGTVKKLGLAITLWKDTDIYVLDEPFSHLDPNSQNVVKDRINELKSKGKAIFFTTHQQNALDICDKVAILEDGKIKFIGTPQSKDILDFFHGVSD